jgi:hypothetical protein
MGMNQHGYRKAALGFDAVTMISRVQFGASGLLESTDFLEGVAR